MKQNLQTIIRPMPIKEISQMNELLERHNVNTVCRSARCPNIGECFKNKEATFMILGNVCTRGCNFCSVKKGKPLPIDTEEPARIAEAVLELGLEYVVITSVTRDDLADGGAGQFVAAINAIKSCNYNIKIEILTPDFNNNVSTLDKIILAKPDCFAHNIETVPSLYGRIRPAANYKNSLSILHYIKTKSDILTKSGIMLGLGETNQEVLEVIKGLRRARCDILTIGQYLRPSADCADVVEFINPEQFSYYENFAKSLGFASAISAPFVRSSYKAKEIYGEAINNGSRTF